MKINSSSNDSLCVAGGGDDSGVAGVEEGVGAVAGASKVWRRSICGRGGGGWGGAGGGWVVGGWWWLGGWWLVVVGWMVVVEMVVVVGWLVVAVVVGGGCGGWWWLGGWWW